MRNAIKLGLVATVVALGSAVAFPNITSVRAQDPEGGIVIENTFGSGPGTLSPIYSPDTASQRMVGLMFPTLLGVNPGETVVSAGAPGALATDYTVSEDGLTYTFTIRSDFNWSDGTPITAGDFEYWFNAVVAPETESRFASYAALIERVTAVDDTTLEVVFLENNCNALNTAAALGAVPRHIYPEDFAELPNFSENLAPTVTGGPYNFSEFRTGELTALVANPDYPDLSGEAPANAGYIYSVVPDQTVLVERFLNGESSWIDTPAVSRRAEIREAEGTQVFDYPGNSWDYIGFNLADPTNPQPAVDEAGNPVDQGFHPIFGDKRVRKAIAYGIDVDAIMEGAVFGEGTRIQSNSVPSSWAYNADIPFYEFDQTQAAALLDEAGWVDSDGDAATPRVCDGCLYAEAGTPLRFTLKTNQGNARREAIGTIVKDQLGQLGFEVDFQAIDFNVLIEESNSQTYDAIIIGWRNGFPDNPDSLSRIFTAENDIPGAGDNDTSFNNEEYTALIEEAYALPGCDQAERAELYGQAQAILAEELPYVFLFVQGGFYAANEGVEGFSPYASQPLWNVDAWTVRSQ
jgi:peptide/nickel transport system substrate-binding protein